MYSHKKANVVVKQCAAKEYMGETWESYCQKRGDSEFKRPTSGNQTPTAPENRQKTVNSVDKLKTFKVNPFPGYVYRKQVHFKIENLVNRYVRQLTYPHSDFV
ncbi:MAG TPA: hypothetical protein VGF79_14105 [Bacteroidia bacterium]